MTGIIYRQMVDETKLQTFNFTSPHNAMTLDIETTRKQN